MKDMMKLNARDIENLNGAEREKYMSDFMQLPVEKMTEGLCMKAVNIDPYIALFLDDNQVLTEKTLMEAAKKDGDIISWLPAEKLSPKVCEAAVKNNGLALEYVPDDLKTEKLCLKAVRENGLALAHIPEKHKSKNLCVVAVDQTFSAIGLLPNELKNEGFYMFLVHRNPKNLMGIPEENITHEMCRMALENTYFKNNKDTSLIHCINQPDIMLRVIQTTKDTKDIDFLISFASPKAFDQKVLLFVAEHRPELMRYIPYQVQTESVRKLFIEKNPAEKRKSGLKPRF